MANILIIDDEPHIHAVLSQMLERLGYDTDFAETMAGGLAAAEKGDFDLVILDLAFPEGNGISILPALMKCASSPEVIILTGAGDEKGAELAYRHGAWDFLQKPFSIKEVTLAVHRAIQYRSEKRTSHQRTVLKRSGIIGLSPEIEACLEQVAHAAAVSANVQITGETGVGKELFARAIHENSDRRTSNFVVLDCTVLPENLVESTLFGHKKGAFTGADRSRDGLIAHSHRGTLFLDEIGELSIDAQKSFLRLLENRSYRPIGGQKMEDVDFRLISATNRDLPLMVEKGLFREDLLFRLRTIQIDVPPLRDRKNDINELTQFFLTRLAEEYQTGPKAYSPEFLHALESYHWPGNVRELIHILERAVAAAGHSPTLYPKHLPPAIRTGKLRPRTVKAVDALPAGDSLKADALEWPTFKEYRLIKQAEAEATYLKALLERSGADREVACRISGLSVPRLYALLKQHGLPRFRNK